MNVCGGLVCGGSRATALPTVLLRHGRARLRCSYSSVTHGTTTQGTKKIFSKMTPKLKKLDGELHLIIVEVADIAQWEDEQIEYIKEKVTEEGRHVDLKKGKASAQVALDEASFLLDLASIDETWDDYVGQLLIDIKRQASRILQDSYYTEIDDGDKEIYVKTEYTVS